jgi:ribonuclease P protein component
MLPKNNRIKKKKDFEIIFKKGKSYKNSVLILKVLNGSLETSRFAVVVSQKVSKKATERNKIRRRITSVIETNFKDIKGVVDVVLVVLPEAKNKGFLETTEAVKDIFLKSGVL